MADESGNPPMAIVPAFAEAITRAQYSRGGAPAGGVTSNRTVARDFASMRKRRGKLWIHSAAHGMVSAGAAKVRRYIRPIESVTGYPQNVETLTSTGSIPSLMSVSAPVRVRSSMTMAGEATITDCAAVRAGGAPSA